MNLYTLFAISCYIILRGLQVLFEDDKDKRWYKTTIRIWTVVMLYAALASLIIFCAEIPFLGFDGAD